MSDEPAESVIALSQVELEGIKGQLTVVFEPEPSLAGLKASMREVEVPFLCHRELQLIVLQVVSAARFSSFVIESRWKKKINGGVRGFVVAARDGKNLAQPCCPFSPMTLIPSTSANPRHMLHKHSSSSTFN